MRIDLLLYRLRLAKSRSVAQAIVHGGRMRKGGRHVVKPSEPVAAGDVIAFPLRGRVQVIEILTLPGRRGPASEARSCYREIGAARENVSQEGAGD